MDISEVTRRAIADELTLTNLRWNGNLQEDQFLARLYNLAELPSTDSRYTHASGDIWKHRVMNSDWPDDWVFTDSRFNLLYCPDDEFLRFLCETVHPVVCRQPDKVAQLLDVYNRHLRADGWEMYPQVAISGHPVFAARPVLDGAAHVLGAARSVAETIDAGYVARQVTRLAAAVQDDPELAIGTAKEFIETICKTILGERGRAADPNWDLLKLVRQTMEALDLVPEQVDDANRAAGTIKALLGNLATIAQRMAELRNPYGTGHGKAAKSRGLKSRHARLAVGAATTLAVFLFETFQEKYPSEG